MIKFLRFEYLYFLLTLQFALFENKYSDGQRKVQIAYVLVYRRIYEYIIAISVCMYVSECVSVCTRA